MAPKLKAQGLLPLLLAAGIFPAGGATRVWTGAQNGLWSNPANWTNGLVPTHLDSIEFAVEARVREMVNDLAGREFGSLTFKGGRYTLSGNKLYLRSGITSIPGNTTNRIDCDIFVGAPMSFVCFGYFNQLEFAGEIEVAHPLRLETSSWIKLSSEINDTDHVGVTQSSSGKVSFGPRGKLRGTLIVERGLLELAGASDGNNLEGRLLVGDDAPGPGAIEARVVWGASDKLGDNTALVVNQSGRLELTGFSEQAGSLRGAGVIDLQAGQLTVNTPDVHSEFAGDLRGTGTLRITGELGGFELSGHSPLTGRIEVADCQLTLSGSVSNAVIALADDAIFGGKGVARSLVTSNATVRPGPGTLRLLESCALDAATTVEFQLDGPEAGGIDTQLLALAGARLQLSYHGLGTENVFTLVSADLAQGDSVFGGLAAGSWIVAGDPGAPSEFRLTYSGNGGHDVVLERTGWFEPPTLNIRLSGTERVIEWPLSAQGYTLQYSPTIGSSDWSSGDLPLPDATTTDFFVIDDSAGGARFYRLFR